MRTKVSELMRRKRNGEKGFTLVELLIVLAVIAVLAVLLLATIPSFLDKQHATQDLKVANELVGAVGKFQNDCGSEPTSIGGLYQSTASSPASMENGGTCAPADGWAGPYMQIGEGTLNSAQTSIQGAFGSADQMSIVINSSTIINGATGVSSQDYVEFSGFNISTAQYLSQKANGNPSYNTPGSQFFATCSTPTDCTGYLIFNNYGG